MNFSHGTVLNNAQQETFIDKQTLVHLDLVSRMNNLGVAAIENGDHEQAGHFLRRALDKASETTFFKIPLPQSPIQKSQEVSSSLYVYQRGEYDEGMHTFSVPLMIDSSRTSLQKAIATVLFNLGQLFLRLNDNEAASTALLRALQMLQLSPPNGSLKETLKEHGGVTLMAILHNVGHVQYRTGQYEEAVRTYAKALQIGKNSYQKTSRDMLEVAATLNCLGVLYFHLPKAETDKAMELYMESLAIHRAIHGANCESKEVATTLNVSLIERNSVMGIKQGRILTCRTTYFSCLLIRTLVESTT